MKRKDAEYQEVEVSNLINCWQHDVKPKMLTGTHGRFRIVCSSPGCANATAWTTKTQAILDWSYRQHEMLSIELAFARNKIKQLASRANSD